MNHILGVQMLQCLERVSDDQGNLILAESALAYREEVANGTASAILHDDLRCMSEDRLDPSYIEFVILLLNVCDRPSGERGSVIQHAQEP